MPRASYTDLSFGEAREHPAVARLIAAKWPGAVAHRLPKRGQLDFSVSLGNEVVAYIEVKARRVAHNAYATTLVSLNKHEVAVHTRNVLGVPVFALIQYTDRLGYFDLCEKPAGTAFVGRADRGGTGTEHCFYPMESFSWIDGPPTPTEAATPITAPGV